ncbi:hypothetical protein L195_g017866 [Trifolium pratense]|uniref:Uncharacterized protein n=1 Tax=Trifolium pratense TaxID=57577 RepID=A0A2K3MV37_TRIPR|nr:hypothetical protein L195_g017866 [Trifolium pratense]
MGQSRPERGKELKFKGLGSARERLWLEVARQHGARLCWDGAVGGEEGWQRRRQWWSNGFYGK